MNDQRLHPDGADLTATKSTAIQFGQWAVQNLRSIGFQCNRELPRAATRDDEVAIAHIGIAFCQASEIIRKAIEQIESGQL